MSSLHQYLGSRCSVSKPSSTDDESHPNFQGHEILNKLKPHVLQSGFQDNIYSRRKLPTDRQSLISPQTKFQNLSSEPSNLNLRWRSSHPVSASGLPNAIDSLSCKRSELRSDADLCPDIFETDLENYDNTVSSSDPDDHDSHGHWPHFNRDIINEFNQYSNVKTTHEMTWRHGNEQGNHRRYYDQFQEDTGRKLIKDVKNNIDDIEDRTIDKDRVMLKEAITKRFISSQDDDEIYHWLEQRHDKNLFDKSPHHFDDMNWGEQPQVYDSVESGGSTSNFEANNGEGEKLNEKNTRQRFDQNEGKTLTRANDKNSQIPKDQSQETAPSNDFTIFKSIENKPIVTAKSTSPRPIQASSSISTFYKPSSIFGLTNKSAVTGISKDIYPYHGKNHGKNEEYVQTQLRQMTYQDLRMEDFDHNHKIKASKSSKNLNSTDLIDKIQYAYELQDGTDLHARREIVFHSLSNEEYETCGELLSDRLDELIGRYNVARRERRTTAEEFEAEVAEREELVRGKKDSVNNDMCRLKSAGEGVIRGKRGNPDALETFRR